jgi:integrase
LVSPNLVPPKDWADERIHVGDNYASIADEDHFRLLAFMQDDLDNWQAKINDSCCHNPPVLRNIKAKNQGGHGKTVQFSRKQPTHGEDYYRLIRRDKETIQEYHYFLQLLWELGASNVDVRELTTDNIDWDSVDEDGEVIGHVIFKRKKWKGFGKGNSRTRMAIYFPMTQALRDLLRPLYAKAKKLPEGKQYLLPKLAGKQSSNITRIFHSYLKAAGVKLEKKCRDGRVRKLVIHSYRYRMAERLYEMGYTEREACMLMGHNDKAVHQAYSKNNAMKVKSMDKMAKEMGKDKIIKINPNKKVA